MNVAKKVILAFALTISLLAPAMPVLAADPFAGICSTPGNGAANSPRGSAVCKTPTSNPLYGSTGIIAKVTRIVAVVTGAIAVIVMVTSGIRYIASGGDSEQVAKSKRGILFAAIGLVVVAIAQGLIVFVVSRI